MVKHTQTIGRQHPTNCLSVFDHFVGLPLKEFTSQVSQANITKSLIQNTLERLKNILNGLRSIFGILSNIYDGEFLRKELTAFSS